MLNSASNYWIGGNHLCVRYSDAVDAAFPYLKYTAPYRDPLFAVITCDGAGAAIGIDGRTSEWVGPSPQELGAPLKDEAGGVTPQIRARELSIRLAGSE
jgi:hypothetical protein